VRRDLIGGRDATRVASQGRQSEERLADVAMLVLGVGAAFTGAGLLIVALPRDADAVTVMAVALYVAGLLSTFLWSALYNLAAEGRRKRRFRTIDHAAIFAMIGGTYTPVALLGIGGAAGWWLFGTVWAGCAGGAVLKLAAPARFERASIVAYLALGWAGLVTIDPLWRSLPPLDLSLLAAGGLLYSAGVAVHLATWLRYHDALWHALVVAGAACHYAVILRLVAGTG